MAKVEQRATSSDPMLHCCLCTGLLRDAVQLACLHNCCRQCFSTAASKSNSKGVACVKCGTVTKVGCEQPNGFIDGQVQCNTLNSESGMCGICTKKGEPEKSAVLMCLACRHSLCEDCVTEHQANDRQHTTQCLEELKRSDELCSQATSTACAVHKLPLDFACINCEQAKCSSCRVQCMKSSHEMHTVGEEPFYSYVEKLVSGISATAKELLRKSEVLEKPRSFLRVTKEARDRHFNALKQRKQRIVDAVERAFETLELSLTSAYDDLESYSDDAVEAADSIASGLSDARNYIRQLLESNDKCEIFKQHKIIRERLSVLSDMLDSLSEHVATTMGEVKIEASLPDDMEEVVAAWIGKLHVYSASSSLLQQQQQQCFSFGAPSDSIQLPARCCDVALTMFGRLLLAAREHGLIEVSPWSGRELSRWRPPKRNNCKEDDWVLAVAALSDGRAAVNVLQCVVLLKRSKERRREKGGGRAAGSSWWQRLVVVAGDDSWTEDLRVELPWFPWELSAHGDVLAASGPDGRLQLLSLSSGQLLSTERQRKYCIGSLAFTARAVVTGSREKVKPGLGRRAAYVLDAHSLADDGSDKRLWRHVLSSSDVEEEEECLQGICADSSGGCLYAAIWSGTHCIVAPVGAAHMYCGSSRSSLLNSSFTVYGSGRVSVLSMVDGSELRRVALSFHPAAVPPAQPLPLPHRLSLSDDATLSSSSGRQLLLAVLYDNSGIGGRAVSVHRCTRDELHGNYTRFNYCTIF